MAPYKLTPMQYDQLAARLIAHADSYNAQHITIDGDDGEVIDIIARYDISFTTENYPEGSYSTIQRVYFYSLVGKIRNLPSVIMEIDPSILAQCMKNIN